jgi:hypothetical protein
MDQARIASCRPPHILLIADSPPSFSAKEG